MQFMMNDHLKLTTDDTVQYLTKNYSNVANGYDRVFLDIHRMSEVLTDSSVVQFHENIKASNIYSA